jgi:Flp pilus assembly protein TadB
VASVPDRDEHRRRFAALDVSDRRAIIKAVNRGQAVETRKHAPLAVGVARQQQRFWRWAWVVGPVIGVVQLRAGWQVALVNGLLGTLFLAALCWFWVTRARRAEEANLERMGKGGKTKPARADDGKGKGKGQGEGKSRRKGGKAGRGRQKSD